jgi:hypothetical protein
MFRTVIRIDILTGISPNSRAHEAILRIFDRHDKSLPATAALDKEGQG